MSFGRSRVLIAFDAGAVMAARLRRGWRGATLEGLASAALEPGVLTPSATERNVARPAEVGEALARVRDRLDLGRGRRVDLILPAGVARPVLLEARETRLENEVLQARLAPGLPFPAREAVVGAQRVARARHVAAAVRRGTVLEYEALAAAADLKPVRVELAPLVALQGLVARPLPPNALDVILGDAAASLVVWDALGPASFRTRLRGGTGDDERLWDEIERLAPEGAAGFAGARFAGRGAAALVQAGAARGRRSTLAWELSPEPVEAPSSELAWLGGALV